MDCSTVLIVEDRQPLADLYTEWLADSYHVRTAYTGQDALSMLDESVDVLLLDRRLPDISGDDIAEIRTNRELECRVAMITAAEPTFETATLGLDDYLTKPISRATLRETVVRLLSKSEDVETESVGSAEIGQSPADAILHRNGASTPITSTIVAHNGDAGHAEIDMERVKAEQLPPVVTDLIAEYDERLGYRDSEFLLKWLHVVFSFFTLTSVDETYAEECRTVRTLASMFVMLVDDLGERHDDAVTLAEAAKFPFPTESANHDAAGIDDDYMAVTEAVWNELDSRLRAAPRYTEIESLFRYDLRQVIHAIRYSALVNEHPEIANMAESRALGAHNMMMLAYADIDIAFSPTFSRAEFGALRSLLLELQQMARIGNWVTTWERELDEGDVSAGVFVSAVESGILTPEELRHAIDNPSTRTQVHERIEQAHVEEALIEQWQQRCDEIRMNQPTIESIDVNKLIDGMEQVMAYHLASRGLK